MPKTKISFGVCLLLLTWFMGSFAVRYADPWGAGASWIACVICAIPGAILLIKGGKSL